MGTIITFPERRRDANHSRSDFPASAMIIILPAVRMERHHREAISDGVESDTVPGGSQGLGGATQS
jgi:hypothetical protein